MLTWNRPVVEPLANRARYRQQGTIAVTGHGRRRSQVKKGFPSLRACRHAPEDRIPKPEWVEKIAPGRIRAGDPENGFAEEPVVGRRSSGVPGLAGKEASNPLPLRVLHHFATQGRPPFFQPRLSMSTGPSAARVPIKRNHLIDKDAAQNHRVAACRNRKSRATFLRTCSSDNLVRQ